MAPKIDLLELASGIAEIARTTADPDTAGKLIGLVEQLLSKAGLPDDDKGGGDLPPGRWLHAAVERPECA